MYVIIAGAGMFGDEIASKLLANKHDVIVIDQDKDVCDSLYSSIGVVA